MSLKKTNAYSFVEIMGAIALMMILMALLLPAISKMQESSRRAEAKTMISRIASAVEMYKLDWGLYPPTWTTPGGRGAPLDSRWLTSRYTAGRNHPIFGAVGGQCSRTGGPYLELKTSELNGNYIRSPWDGVYHFHSVDDQVWPGFAPRYTSAEGFDMNDPVNAGNFDVSVTGPFVVFTKENDSNLIIPDGNLNTSPSTWTVADLAQLGIISNLYSTESDKD